MAVGLVAGTFEAIGWAGLATPRPLARQRPFVVNASDRGSAELRRVDWHMLKPAFFYFALTFAVGFALGSVRMLVLAPRFGEVGAVLIESPFMLVASFLIARLVLRRFAPTAGAGRRLLIGLLAFAMLLTTELLMSWLRGIGPGEFVASLFKTAGAIGLAGQVLFALFPLFIAPRAASPSQGHG
jgi:hypothetical protein